MRPRRLLALAVGCLAACSSKQEPGSIEGRVLWQGKPVAAALVGAYPRAEQDVSTPPLAEAASAEDGAFRIAVAPGRYWVWARATVSLEGRDHRLVGQARPSPTDVASGEAARAEVDLRDPSGFAASAGPAGAGVRGRARGGGQGRSFVYAYPGRDVEPVGPGFAAAKALEADGSFRLDLRPGPYTLAFRKRSTGENFGALALGDRVARVPVEVGAARYEDLGVVELRPVDPDRHGRARKASPAAATEISGRVADAGGTPVEGMRILAFRDSKMAGKPLSLSAPTGADGSFVLPLPGGGTYFLGARSRLGGPAEPGERVGSYRGDDGGGLELGEGEKRQGIEIPVEEVW